MIYFDAAATTKPSKTAIKTFVDVSENCWFNPSSTMYDGGRDARNLLEQSRATIARCINAEPEQIIFTSGSTEAANLVLNSSDAFTCYCSPIEHPCVYNPVYTMWEGFDEIPVSRLGVADINRMFNIMYGDNRRHFWDTLVCLMFANNELGSVQNIYGVTHNDAVPRMDYKVMCDMTQSFAHGNSTQIDVKYYDVDYAFGSAQKFGAFKGTGFLYAKDPSTLNNLMYGGHQENNLRPGTENVAGIAAMAAQFDEVCRQRDYNYWLSQKLRNYIIDRLPDCARVNGGERVLPNILSVTLDGIDANKLIAFLNLDGIYLSAGSACSTGENKPSRILKACGFTDDEARSTIRISFTAENTIEEATKLVNQIDYHIKEGLCKLE